MPIPVTFTVHYATNPGEEVCVAGNRNELGHWSVSDALKLNYVANGIWQGRVSLAAGTCEYKYIVRRGEMSTWEPSDNHKVQISEEAVFADSWNVAHTVYDTVAKSKICKDAIFRRGEAKVAPVISIENDAVVLKISVKAPWIAPTESVRIISDNSNIFGDGITLYDGDFPIFKRELRLETSQYYDLPKNSKGLPQLSFKFAIIDANGKEVTCESNYRIICLPNWAKGSRIGRVVYMNSGDFRYPTSFNYRCAGVAVPVFSLRSSDSFGCGDFNDLKQLVDFCYETHLHLVQILPVNDTMIHGDNQVHWWDSYPYSPVSVFALHPLYAHIEACVDQGVELPDTVQHILETRRKELNDLDAVDYEEVLSTKLTMLRAIFAEDKKRESVQAQMTEFIRENKFWLQPYAVFKALSALHCSTNFRSWDEKSHRLPGPDFITGFFEHKPDTEALLVGNNTLEEVRFWCWVQMRLFSQIRDSVRYAEEHRIGVKGDIPIGCDPNSSDVWAYNGLFKKDAVVGAPPDPFSETGQNWGFPAYDWEAMAKDEFRWWKNRLNVMSRYAHAYRIDHVLGFFRIWEIPADRVSGMCGYFVPSRPIHINELQERGIWDLDRLCNPYMPERIVKETLGSDLFEKFAFMFTEDETMSQHEKHLKFVEEFNTEKKIEQWFLQNFPQTTDEEQRIARDYMAALFRITSNVILLRDRNEPERQFYPRFGLHTTSSFRDLHGYWKSSLHSFCHDYFYRWGDDIFAHSAHSKLPSLIEASNGMLVCAEDLGFLSPCVPGTLTHYDILSLIVQRMPSNPNITFSHPNDSNWLSVVTPGTHDMPPIRLWWDQLEPYKRELYWYNILGRQEPPAMTLAPSDCRNIVDQHMYSPSMLAIYPLQDILAAWASQEQDGTFKLSGVELQTAEDERINEPAVRRWNWGWRCPVSLEKMNSSSILISELNGLVTNAGRDQYHAKY